MPHPRGPLGIGIDLLHLPRLMRVIFSPAKTGVGGYGCVAGQGEGERDERLRKFAGRILSVEEGREFERRFLRGGEERGRWRQEVGRWLGVRWAAKEAVYKAYPFPGEGQGQVHGHGKGRLTWKEVTLRYDGVSGKPYLVIDRLGTKFAEGKQKIPVHQDGGSGDVRFKEEEEQQEKEDSALLSVTHDGEYICAMVMYTGGVDAYEGIGRSLLGVAEGGLRGKMGDGGKVGLKVAE